MSNTFRYLKLINGFQKGTLFSGFKESGSWGVASVSPLSLEVRQGSSSSVQVTVTRNEFNENIEPKLLNVPQGVNYTFNPAILDTNTNTTTLTFDVTDSSIFDLTTRMIVSGLPAPNQNKSLDLRVLQRLAPRWSISGPAFMSINQGETKQYNFSVNKSDGYTSPTTFTISGLPSGVTAQFSPTSTSGGANENITLTLTASSNLGTVGTNSYTITISGSPAPSNAIEVSLAVTVPESTTTTSTTTTSTTTTTTTTTVSPINYLTEFTYSDAGNGLINFYGSASTSDGSVVPTQWLWDFSHNGVTSNNQNTSHQYTSDATYVVYLTVTYSNGVSRTVTNSVEVVGSSPFISVDIPLESVLTGSAYNTHANAENDTTPTFDRSEVLKSNGPSAPMNAFDIYGTSYLSLAIMEQYIVPYGYEVFSAAFIVPVTEFLPLFSWSSESQWQNFKGQLQSNGEGGETVALYKTTSATTPAMWGNPNSYTNLLTKVGNFPFESGGTEVSSGMTTAVGTNNIPVSVTASELASGVGFTAFIGDSVIVNNTISQYRALLLQPYVVKPITRLVVDWQNVVLRVTVRAIQ